MQLFAHLPDACRLDQIVRMPKRETPLIPLKAQKFEYLVHNGVRYTIKLIVIDRQNILAEARVPVGHQALKLNIAISSSIQVARIAHSTAQLLKENEQEIVKISLQRASRSASAFDRQLKCRSVAVLPAWI